MGNGKLQKTNGQWLTNCVLFEISEISFVQSRNLSFVTGFSKAQSGAVTLGSWKAHVGYLSPKLGMSERRICGVAISTITCDCSFILWTAKCSFIFFTDLLIGIFCSEQSHILTRRQSAESPFRHPTVIFLIVLTVHWSKTLKLKQAIFFLFLVN